MAGPSGRESPGGALLDSETGLARAAPARGADGQGHRMTEGAAALTYAVRPAVVGRYLGQLALVQAAVSTVPLAVALGSGDRPE